MTEGGLFYTALLCLLEEVFMADVFLADYGKPDAVVLLDTAVVIW